jgi:hypothetical protein
MKIASYSRIFILVLGALALQACGPGGDQSGQATTDTAVHDAGDG